MNIRLLSLAVEDLRVGRDFYECQLSGLGTYFLDSLFSDIDSLQLHAGLHVQQFGYYRALSKRFPYAIYYKLSGGDVEVWRVLDCRQHPRRMAKALKSPT